MSDVRIEELTDGVTFRADFDVNSLKFDEEFGFMEVDAGQVATGGLRQLVGYVGFAAPYSREGFDTTSDVVKPITEYRDLPLGAQKLDIHGKGVGPRLFNARVGLSGMPENPPVVGLYLIEIDADRIKDMRDEQGSKVHQVMNHAGKLASGLLWKPERVIAKVHASYKGADAVLLKTPPLPLERIRQKDLHHPDWLESRFMTVRSAGVLLQKIGEAPSLG